MLTGKTFAEVYQKLVGEIFENGEVVKPRGMETRELLQETFCIEDPASNLAYIPNRMFSIVHAVWESYLLFVKNNEVKVASMFNKEVRRFSDDGKTLYGSYGYRIAESIPAVINKLKMDKDTRQALLTIHRVEDTSARTLDTPCTITLQFTIRNNKLNMHVYMRSNDIFWGTPYDVYNFTNLQQVIANTLGISVGKYYHTATSLHMYARDYDKVELVMEQCEPRGYRNPNVYNTWKSEAEMLVAKVQNSDSVYTGQHNPTLNLLSLQELYEMNEVKAFEEDVAKVAKYKYSTFPANSFQDFTKRFRLRWGF